MKVGMYNLQRKEYMHTLVGVVEVIFFVTIIFSWALIA
jgi:hypothetical protein